MKYYIVDKRPYIVGNGQWLTVILNIYGDNNASTYTYVCTMHGRLGSDFKTSNKSRH